MEHNIINGKKDVIAVRDICVPAKGKKMVSGGQGLKSHITKRGSGDSLHLALQKYIEKVFPAENVVSLDDYIQSKVKKNIKYPSLKGVGNGIYNEKVSASIVSIHNNKNEKGHTDMYSGSNDNRLTANKLFGEIVLIQQGLSGGRGKLDNKSNNNGEGIQRWNGLEHK